MFKDLFESPHAAKHRGFPRRKISGRPGCSVCSGNDPFILIDDMNVDACFFTCASEPCEARVIFVFNKLYETLKINLICFPNFSQVHNDCAGFPGIDYEDVKVFMPYWCKVHRGAGRPPVDYSKQSHVEPTPTISPTAFVTPCRHRSRSGARLAANPSSSTPNDGKNSGGNDSLTSTPRRHNQSGDSDTESDSGTSRGR